MKSPIVILYKDHTYKILGKNKLFVDYTDPRIKMIMVPCYEARSCYIPIKSSNLLEFSRVHIDIVHSIFAYDMENMQGDDLNSLHFEIDCENLIELANGIFNLFKFRGVSTTLAESDDEFNTLSFTAYPTHIRLEFYNKEGEMFDKIDSGEMTPLGTIAESIEWGEALNPFIMSPPQYHIDDRFECLSPLTIVPMEYDHTLANIINVFDQKHWRKVRNIYKEVADEDFMFFKLKDFSVYYYIAMEDFKLIDTLLLQLASKGSANISLVSYIVNPKYEPDVLPSADQNRKPSESEKAEAIIAYNRGQIANAIPNRFFLDDVSKVLQLFTFMGVLINYCKYFTSVAYDIRPDEDVDEKVKCFVMFESGKWTNAVAKILTENELNEENIIKMVNAILGGLK